MAITVMGANEGTMQRQLPPAENLPARCVQIVDLGTQEEEWSGEKSLKRKIRLTWELPTVEFTGQEGDTWNPIISKEYTASLHEKATLRKHLESWRGKPFNSTELEGFDVGKLLDKTCMVQVGHKQKATGGEYAVIANISKLPKGMDCPDRVRDLMEYSADEGDTDTYRGFPDWLKERIAASPEFAKGKKKGTNTDHEPSEAVPF